MTQSLETKFGTPQVKGLQQTQLFDDFPELPTTQL